MPSALPQKHIALFYSSLTLNIKFYVSTLQQEKIKEQKTVTPKQNPLQLKIKQIMINFKAKTKHNKLDSNLQSRSTNYHSKKQHRS